jgi:hypothetical protein
MGVSLLTWLGGRGADGPAGRAIVARGSRRGYSPLARCTNIPNFKTTKTERNGKVGGCSLLTWPSGNGGTGWRAG